MTTEKKIWSEPEQVQRFSWKKKILPRETRIAKATANVARRNGKP